MPGTGLTVEGDQQLRVTLKRAAADLLAPTDLNQEAGDYLVNAAGPFIPRDTGALGNSGHADGDAAGATLEWDESYAGPQHYGVPSHNIEPHPWAIEASQDTSPVVSIYATGVQHILNRVKGI